MKPSNQPLQPSGTRLQAGAARRAGSCHRLNGGVRWRWGLASRLCRLGLASAATSMCLVVAAFAAAGWRTFESKKYGYRVQYPSSWYLFNLGVDALEILNFPPNERIEGVVIRSGGAIISVAGAPPGVHNLDEWIDQNVRLGGFTGRREIPVVHPPPDGCGKLTRVDTVDDVSGSGKAFQVTATFYCVAHARLYAIAVTNWKDDPKQPQYWRVALEIAESLRAGAPTR